MSATLPLIDSSIHFDLQSRYRETYTVTSSASFDHVAPQLVSPMASVSNNRLPERLINLLASSQKTELYLKHRNLPGLYDYQ